jgi:hypothetical protein
VDNMGLDERRVLLYDMPVTRRLSLLCLSLCVSWTRTVRGQHILAVLVDECSYEYTNGCCLLFPEKTPWFIVRVDYDWGNATRCRRETRPGRPA